MATLLVAGLAGQLGGDDFEIRVDTVVNEGRELAHYKQGLRGTETIVTSTAVARGLTRPMIEEILASKSSTDPIPVELSGFGLGGIEDLHLVCEYRLPGGEIHVTNIDARGKGTRVPPELRRWFGPDPDTRRALAEQVVGIAQMRAPDFTAPRHVGGLVWVVDGWRVKLPGRDEIVYLSGRRADGVGPARAP